MQYTEKVSLGNNVTLVDMVIVIIRRRRLFFSVFALILLSGFFLAAFLPGQYEYVSLIKVAHKGNQTQIEPPEVSEEAFNSRWLPEMEEQYAAEFSSKPQFNVQFSYPNSTGLIRIATKGRQKYAENVQYFHQGLLKKISEHQQALVKRERNRINRQIETASEAISELSQQDIIPEAAAIMMETRSALKIALEGIEEPHTFLTGRQSSEPVGPHRNFIFSVAIILGLVLAIFTVVLAEFISAVRDKLTSGYVESPDVGE